MSEMSRLNEKRREAIEKIKPTIEELINNGELFCPHDVIVIQQGNIQVYSGAMSTQLKILD